ncbi:hypothetical protein DCC79_06080 [bacterium]|nr:MAG: hypothetical protein DCC79_06080 [bacterium]
MPHPPIVHAYMAARFARRVCLGGPRTAPISGMVECRSGGMLEEPGTGQHFRRNAGTAMGSILDDTRAAAPAVFARLTIA